MKNQLIATIALAAGMLVSPPKSFASGGFWCVVDDDNLSFTFRAGMGRMNLGGWFNTFGGLETKGNLVPTSIASFEISSELVTQRWFDEHDIRLEVQKSTPDDYNVEGKPLFANVRLHFIAKATDWETYEGPYLLDLLLENGSRVQKHGTVECSAD